MYLDAHIHLQDVLQKERHNIIATAKDNQFEYFFCNSIKMEDWPIIQDLALHEQMCVPFFGIHPWFADKVEDGWDKNLVQMLQSIPSGVGETGLDKTERAGDFAKQKIIFRRHIEIALELDRPLIIHSVRCWGTLIEILRKYKITIPYMIHCFLGPAEVAREFVRAGAYFSISLRVLSSKYEEQMKAILKELPLDRLMFETDYPYKPAAVEDRPYADYIKDIYEQAAVIKDVSVAQLQEATLNNAKNFLNKIIVS